MGQGTALQSGRAHYRRELTFQDLMRKEYMGETAVRPIDWFSEGKVALWDENLPVRPDRLILSDRVAHSTS